MGSVEQNLAALNKAQIFSTFAMSSGFFAIPLEEEDRKYFTFNVPDKGQYCFTATLFGWVNSPAYYSKFMF